jgi:hypothetical protein
MITTMTSRRTAGARNKWTRFATALLPALSLFALSAAFAQSPPFDESKTLSSAVEPIERDFDIGESGRGRYKVTLTDLGAQLQAPAPAPLASVQLIITRDATVVAVLDGTPTGGPQSAVDTMEFDATPGKYFVHVVGIPGPDEGSGPVGVKIDSTGPTPTNVLSFSGTLAPPATTAPDLITYQLEVTIPADGAYELSLNDLAFPRAGSLQLTSGYLFQAGGSTLAGCVNLTVQAPCAPTVTVNLTAGTYQWIAGGKLADGMDAALFSFNIKSVADGTVVHTRTVELGAVKRISDTSFQLDAGAYTLSRTDLLFPSKLAEASAIVTRSGQMVALANEATSDVGFTVAADDTPHDVFAYAKSDSVAPATGAGSFDIELKPNSGPAALSFISAMGDVSGSPTAYTFPVDITAGGKYTLKFGDFQFPAALGSARLAVVQNGTVVSKTDPNSPSSLDATLDPGSATVVVVVKPAAISGTLEQAGGTFGLGMSNGTQNVLDVTQGVGGLVSIRKVSIVSEGRYDLKVSDLDAPDVFGDLMVVISRGSVKLGQAIVGSGGTNPEGAVASLNDLNLPVGNYSITLIANPDNDLKAATYGLSMKSSPPAPTVTLTVTPTTIEAGKTVGLQWSSQGATSCTASSNPSGVWAGTKVLTGTDSSGPVTAATTFTLKCTDASNRTTEKSVSVEISAQNNNGGSGGGGGGAFDWLTLVALTLAVGLHLGRRRAAGAPSQMTDL